MTYSGTDIECCRPFPVSLFSGTCGRFISGKKVVTLSRSRDLHPETMNGLEGSKTSNQLMICSVMNPCKFFFMWSGNSFVLLLLLRICSRCTEIWHSTLNSWISDPNVAPRGHGQCEKLLGGDRTFPRSCCCHGKLVRGKVEKLRPLFRAHHEGLFIIQQFKSRTLRVWICLKVLASKREKKKCSIELFVVFVVGYIGSGVL